MAVPKTTQTRYTYGWQCAEDYTSNPIPTSFFVYLYRFCCVITGNNIVRITKNEKNDVGMGLLV